MKLHSINTSFNSNYKTNFKQDQAEKAPVKKTGLFEKFHEKTKNSADMTDTIVVPRTIFKGYLGIMAGTTLITAGSLLGKTPGKNIKSTFFCRSCSFIIRHLRICKTVYYQRCTRC